MLISLVVSLYKLLVKVLVGRPFGVMDKLIFPNQFVFLKGRFLVDGVVALNELTDMDKKSKNIVLSLKWIFKNPMIR